MKIKTKVKQSAIFKIALCFFILLLSCKSKQPSSPISTNTNETDSSAKIEGRVTHQYKLQGCETIIVCKPTTRNDTLFLIPMTQLEKFDVDGLKISFNYRILRIHNPKGCGQGIPAQISNISSTKH